MFIFPCTICSDRMNGAYSGDKWIAFPSEDEWCLEIAYGGDIIQMEFYYACNGEVFKYIGVGNTPNNAMENLKEKLLVQNLTTDQANYELSILIPKWLTEEKGM